MLQWIQQKACFHCSLGNTKCSQLSVNISRWSMSNLHPDHPIHHVNVILKQVFNQMVSDGEEVITAFLSSPTLMVFSSPSPCVH